MAEFSEERSSVDKGNRTSDNKIEGAAEGGTDDWGEVVTR